MTAKEALPFSLSCYDCDLGDGIDTREQAILLGWTRIIEEDGEWFNYLGMCPECRKLEETPTV